VEQLARAELARLGLRPGRTVPGGVELAATTRQLYVANVWMRTATRVLVRLGSFEARTFAELETRAGTLPWDRYLDGRPATYRVTSTASELHHTDAVAQRVARASGSAQARTTPPDSPGRDGAPHDEGAPLAPLVVVRVVRDQVTVSVDASGEPLYKRGWRQAVAKAPLREALAAAALAATGWDGSTPLVDPFCGSGTIPIEAALLASGMAPGAQRSFAFQAWPSFEPGTWASVRAGLTAVPTETSPPAPIVGSDRDAGAVDAARANAERAGVSHLVRFERAAVSDVGPPTWADGPGGPGWVLTNPPYGARVGGPDLRDLYARLGQVLGARFAGWRVGLLVADPVLAGHAGVRAEELLRTSNGGIPVRLLADHVG
jgi:putative N6-adenine-specific DNA methylase